MTLPIRASFVVLLASVAILGTALASQYWGGLGPCVLCLYQRYPYGVVIGLMVIAVVIGQNRPGPVIALLGMASLAFLVGAGIGFFHVGVEQHWWAGTPECGATETARTIQALRAQ
ncbi:MAG: disulfide bond formation protein B, partial [Alphaproteobacteria bacterium]|nr:disulfide bond formation protein B [Alphaproteobacteria bacterium]